MRVESCNIQRPIPSENVCGDITYVKQSGDNFFFAVVDVAGHGSEAANLADQCFQFFKSHDEAPLLEMMNKLHETFHGTRGFAVSLCRLNCISGLLEFVGTGNITTRIFGPNQRRLIPRDGVVGYRMPRPKLTTLQLSPGDNVVLHSDGVREHFEPDDYPRMSEDTVEIVTKNIIEYFGKEKDDASCVVVRLLDD